MECCPTIQFTIIPESMGWRWMISRQTILWPVLYRQERSLSIIAELFTTPGQITHQSHDAPTFKYLASPLESRKGIGISIGNVCRPLPVNPEQRILKSKTWEWVAEKRDRHSVSILFTKKARTPSQQASIRESLNAKQLSI